MPCFRSKFIFKYFHGIPWVGSQGALGNDSKRIFIVIGLCLCFMNLFACAQQNRYKETHEISQLKVVFLDNQSLQEIWESKTGKPSTQFQPWLRGDLAAVKTVRGFYDFSTETLYCPKWNYEVCGHELHHAALGHFHPNN